MSSAPAPPSPLMHEKLAPPPRPDTPVARERLNEHFVLDERTRLLAVHAPPGYGKTMLLAERLPALEQRAAWLRLDDHDNDPDRFGRYFEAALGGLLADVGVSTGPSAETGHLTLPALMERHLAELPTDGSPCRLIIDEAEHIDDPQIVAGLRYWLRHQPRWFTLTVVGRRLPPLGLPGLRLRGELEEIGAGELAFQQEEAQTLFADRLSIPPTRVSVERALRRTEGWAMALNWLVERTTTRASFDAMIDRLSGAHPDFVAWFDELLEETLCDDDRRVLLQLGVLERFSPELVARLLEGDRVSQRLEAFESAGLFIQRPDPHDQWCRFHELFAEYLRYRRNELSLDSQRRLHRQASEAWLALGDPALALAQAIEADDSVGLAELIEAQGPQLLANGRFALLARGLDALGDPVVSRSPRLTLLMGWVTHAQHQFARTTLCVTWSEANEADPEWQELASEFLTLRALCAINQGDAAQAAPLAARALTLPARYLAATPASAASILGESRFVQGQLDESLERVREVEREAHRIGDDQLLLHTLCQQSEALVAQGRLQAAFDIQERAFAHIEHCGLDGLPVAEFLYRIRSQLLWEWHRLDEAEEAALNGIAVLESRGERWTLQCHIALANVAQARGDQAQCADHIRRIRKGLSDGDYHLDWLANAHALLIAWWQSTDDLDAVARWLGEAPTADAATATNHFVQCNARNHARALTLLARPDEARELLLALEAQTEQYGLVTDANRNRIVLAAAEWRAGNAEAALDHMSHALKLAGHTAIVGSFLRLGGDLVEILRALTAERELDTLASARVDRLLELAGRRCDFSSAVRLMLDDSVIADIVARPDVPELIRTSPLTRREWQILGLIHAGLSNEQIAEQLAVAPTTIKTHIRSLYQKQNIRSRQQAVEFARELLARIEG